MAKLYSSLQQLPVVALGQGNCVRYIGADPKVQQDYGDQDLQVIAIDSMSGIAICDNKRGQRLVGVAVRDLQGL